MLDVLHAEAFTVEGLAGYRCLMITRPDTDSRALYVFEGDKAVGRIVIDEDTRLVSPETFTTTTDDELARVQPLLESVGAALVAELEASDAAELAQIAALREDIFGVLDRTEA